MNRWARPSGAGVLLFRPRHFVGVARRGFGRAAEILQRAALRLVRGRIELNYYHVVDIFLAGIVGVRMYFWFSGPSGAASPARSRRSCIYTRFSRFPHLRRNQVHLLQRLRPSATRGSTS